MFNQTGSILDESIRGAIEAAAGWILKVHCLEHINLETVTTKTNSAAIFASYARLCMLRKPDVVFDANYIRTVFRVYALPYNGIPEEFFYGVTLADPRGAWAYKKSFGSNIRRGLGALLVALHASKAITLPHIFRWPCRIERHDKDNIKRKVEVCDLESLPELLRFIRSLETQTTSQNAGVFSNLTKKQRERLFWLGTRLILITGWITPSDANYDDLLQIKDESESTKFSGAADLGIVVLIDVLERNYKLEFGLSVAGWKQLLKQRSPSSSTKTYHYLQKKESEHNFQNIDEESILAELIEIDPAGVNPSQLSQLKGLPGLGIDLFELTKTWLVLETTYLNKIKRENYRFIQYSLGYLNLYLFLYLSYWFENHKNSSIQFPSTPEKLISSLFISDLGLSDEVEKPKCFVDFISYFARAKKWQPQTHYAILKQVEKFFAFLEQHSESLPRCKGFRQPLNALDYPVLARSNGTSKRPIPRRIFSFYLSFVEALSAHTEALLNRILTGEIGNEDLKGFGSQITVIDTFARQDTFGFIPIVFYKGKIIPLRYIPNTIDLEMMNLKDGRRLRIPKPHSLNHILVVLHTGLRNNHVQWLDAETFDMFVEEGHHDFTKLYVNTDKVMTKGWSAHVYPRVIEILRKQLQWRNLIDEPGFVKKVHYNNNEKSKWGSFYPLFSASTDGRPHSDARYEATWKQVLFGVQAMMLDIGEPNIRLCRLLPSNISYRDLDMDRKLYEYGSKEQHFCSLTIKSDITPHSARVSVVSHTFGILPADIIGRYLTGQSESTVYHYVVLDEDEIFVQQQLQNLSLRQVGFNEGYSAMITGEKNEVNHSNKVEKVNSRLGESLRANLEETIISYGCTSLSLTENMTTGIDILRETRAIGATENKTEICPYGNNCPNDIIKQFQALRRCGLCQYAVRSIDHLPAVTAKGRQLLEILSEIELKLDAENLEVTFTLDEIDLLEEERNRLAEDLTAWKLVEDVLELTRQRISSGESDKRWVVQRPDIIERDLKRVPFPSNGTEYVLARLTESVAYPMLESPQIRARFDLLRRQLLAKSGSLREAFNSQIPINPAVECLGLIRSVVAANKLTYKDLLEMLEGNKYIEAIPNKALHFLTEEF